MLIVPAFYVEEGRLVRPHPFSTADQVFGGSLATAVRAFLDQTMARVFYLIDVGGGASSDATLAEADELIAAKETLQAKVLLSDFVDLYAGNKELREQVSAARGKLQEIGAPRK